LGLGLSFYRVSNLPVKWKKRTNLPVKSVKTVINGKNVNASQDLNQPKIDNII
jgi:hypothetical protein